MKISSWKREKESADSFIFIKNYTTQNALLHSAANCDEIVSVLLLVDIHSILWPPALLLTYSANYY